MPLSLLTTVTSDTPPGAILKAGASVVFTLDGGVLLTLTGTPQLQLSNGEVANFIGNDANGKPQFKYTVAPGDDTADLKAGSLVGATVSVLGLTVDLNIGPGADTGIVIDTTAPTSPATPILDAASDTGALDGVTSIKTPTFTGSAEAGSTITLYDGTTAVGTATASASGTYAITSATLGDGTHSLHVTATDAAGNVSAASANLSITVTDESPVIPATPAAPTLDALSDTGTSATDGITSDATPTFNGTASVGSTITLYDGTTAVGTASVGTDGTYAITTSTLGDGNHTLHVTATDAAGNVSAASDGVDVTIKTVAPVTPGAPALSADSGANGVSNLVTPTLTGTAEEGSIVKLFDGTRLVGTAVADATNTYTITSSQLANGVHSLTVTATDAAGNVSNASTPSPVTIDSIAPQRTAAPVLTAAFDTGKSATDGITSIATPTFSGTTEPGMTITLYDGDTVVGTAVAGLDGSYALTSSALADGTHALTTTLTDIAGNVSPRSPVRNITIDTTAPLRPLAPTLTAASDHGWLSTDQLTNDNTPTFTGIAEAGATVQLTVDKGQTVVGTATVRPDGTYTITSSVIADGSHYFEVTVTDAAGNVSLSSPALSGVRIDTAKPTAPTVSLAAGMDGGVSTVDGLIDDRTPTFTGRAEAASTVTLYDGTRKVGQTTALQDGSYKIIASELGDGTHALHVTATDRAGNVSDVSADVNLTIDTRRPTRLTAPKLSALSDSGSSVTDRLTNDNRPVFTGTAEAGSTVTLMMDDARTVVGTAVAGADGAYSIASSLIADGSHYFTVQATDAAGNISQVSAALSGVRIDTETPNVAIANIGGATSRATQTITGTGEIGSTVKLTKNGVAVGRAVTVGSDGTWTTNVTLSAGSNTIVANDTDKAGNVGVSQAVSFNYSSSATARAASLNNMVQAMSTTQPSASLTMTPSASPPAAEAHQLAAAH